MKFPFKLSRNLSVQSKLLGLVLIASLTSLLLTGLLSFGVARNLLAESGYERLNALRNARAVAVRDHIEELSDHVMTLSEARMTIDATKRFSQAFNQLPDINDAQKKELKNYYETVYIPRLQKASAGDPRAATYYPSTPAERYLKYFYSAPLQTAEQTQKAEQKAAKLEEAEKFQEKDNTAWGATYKEYQAKFKRLKDLFDYEDIMIADIKTGHVVYSTSSMDDLGSNLISGPYAETQEGEVFRQVKRSKDPFFLTITDFEAYKPDMGKPTMFIGTSIFDGDEFIGALIFQLNNERVDRLMTSSGNWKDVGLGKSGETFLVGQDFKFRSSPRPFLEDPRKYLDNAKAKGTSEKVVEAIKKTGTPVLVQPVKTKASLAALDGKTGLTDYKDYRGVDVIGSYQPISFGPFDWALIAKIDQNELYSGIHRLARNLLLLAAILIPAITFLALAMARAFNRPIRRLLDATEKISTGDYNIRIPVMAGDEFGELATAFNAMSDKLSEREHTLKEQVEENDRLMRSILPNSAADRMKKQGAEGLAETHPNVSVLFAEIEGWDGLSKSLSLEASMDQLNELTSALDNCAEEFDVEKLQDVGSTYLAVSGLSHPRIDHEKRAVDCALALLKVMDRFNAKYNVDLTLDIGIHAGPLTTGVMSGERLSFDIWGQTINIARGVHESPKRNVIQVTAPVEEALRGLYHLEALAPIEVRGHGQFPVWEVQGPISPSAGGRGASIQEASQR